MGNKIHPTAIIEGDVELGSDNEILAYTVLRGPLKIGSNNRIGPHVVIGGPGQDTRHPRYDDSQCRIEIGDRNIIREFTGVQKPCYRDLTRIENDVFIMQSVHVPHDAIIQSLVVITPMVVLAGITTLMTGANIGMGATIQQYVVVGPYSMVAMGAPVTKNVPPFSRFIPRQPLSVNDYAIKKFGFEAEAGEIKRYLLEGILPTSEKLRIIIESYLKAHTDSKQNQY